MEQTRMGIHAQKMDSEDAMLTVRDKLSVITDLLDFDESLKIHQCRVGFRYVTFAGISQIISDCINTLDMALPERGA